MLQSTMKQVWSYVVLSRLLFVFFALIAAFILPLNSGYIGKQVAPNAPYLAWIWANFDGRHFIHIATGGYHNFDFAYFPLYPLVIFILTRATSLLPLYLGLLTSIVSFIAAIFFTYRIIRIDYQESTARLAIFFMCIFPVSFFYHSVYTDSLFLLVSTTSFYFARKGRWVWAGIFAGLATADRVPGLTLLPALLLEWYLQNKKSLVSPNKLLQKFLKNGFITMLLGVAGISSYMYYLYKTFHDPLVFQKSMIAWKQSSIVFPPQVIFRYLKIFYYVDYHSLVFWIALLEFAAFFLYLTLTIYVWRKVRSSYGLFMLLLLLMVTFTGTFAGTPRYLLQLFPGFLGLALWTKDKPRLLYVLSTLFLVLGFVLTSLFTRGYFVS